MSSSSHTDVRYLDVMTCRSSNPNAVASSTSLLSHPLYLSDMSHVDVKLASTEVAGPVNMFYPNGAKSTHMRQKLEDAIWEVRKQISPSLFALSLVRYCFPSTCKHFLLLYKLLILQQSQLLPIATSNLPALPLHL